MSSTHTFPESDGWPWPFSCIGHSASKMIAYGNMQIHICCWKYIITHLTFNSDHDIRRSSPDKVSTTHFLNLTFDVELWPLPWTTWPVVFPATLSFNMRISYGKLYENPSRLLKIIHHWFKLSLWPWTFKMTSIISMMKFAANPHGCSCYGGFETCVNKLACSYCFVMAPNLKQ